MQALATTVIILQATMQLISCVLCMNRFTVHYSPKVRTIYSITEFKIFGCLTINVAMLSYITARKISSLVLRQNAHMLHVDHRHRADIHPCISAASNPTTSMVMYACITYIIMYVRNRAYAILCMYVCMCLCMSVCKNACMRFCKYLCIHAIHRIQPYTHD